MNSETTLTFLATQRRPLTAEKIARWRKQRGLGQGAFGKLFKSADCPNGYSRVYISRLERDIFPITRKFSERFDDVRADWHKHNKEKGSGLIEIVSKYRMPHALKISRKPRRCRECKEWFVPAHSRHVRCGECKSSHGRNRG